MNDVVQMITTLGFPIVCCAALFYQNWKLEDRHQKEIAQLSEVLKNNTSAIVELSTIIKERKI